MEKIVVCVCFYIFICHSNVYGANILIVAPFASHSHHIWNKALAVGLQEKGHNITYISADKEKSTNTSTYLQFENLYENLQQDGDMNEIASYSPLDMMYAFLEDRLMHYDLISKTQGLKTLLNYPEDFKFDLLIFDITIGPCLYPLIERFGYPAVVGVTPFLLPSYVSYTFGNGLLPSYLPWYGLPYTNKMNFWQRTESFVLTHWDLYLRRTQDFSHCQRLAGEIFGPDTRPLKEFEEYFSLVLANTDPILDFPQPLPPNIVPVGGLHTRRTQAIPGDLQKLLDGAEDGVVLFSLGTNVRSDKLDENIRKAILQALGEIPELVIWKFESELENLPKNVVIKKWLPQNDILAHPNVKLFIGHGGALSTQEAVYHGVPMIGIPFMIDQYINSKMIVDQKLGLKVDFKSITKTTFQQTIREVLDNPTYAGNAKEKSRRFRDRTETPLERGVFWIEYVLRHGGAKFLSPQSRYMPFFQATSYDVIGFLLVTVVTALFLVYVSLKFVVGMFSAKRKVKTN